jgi:hypothetical protein
MQDTTRLSFRAQRGICGAVALRREVHHCLQRRTFGRFFAPLRSALNDTFCTFLTHGAGSSARNAGRHPGTRTACRALPVGDANVQSVDPTPGCPLSFPSLASPLNRQPPSHTMALWTWPGHWPLWGETLPMPTARRVPEGPRRPEAIVGQDGPDHLSVKHAAVSGRVDPEAGFARCLVPRRGPHAIMPILVLWLHASGMCAEIGTSDWLCGIIRQRRKRLRAARIDYVLTQRFSEDFRQYETLRRSVVPKALGRLESQEEAPFSFGPLRLVDTRQESRLFLLGDGRWALHEALEDPEPGVSYLRSFDGARTRTLPYWGDSEVGSSLPGNAGTGVDIGPLTGTLESWGVPLEAVVEEAGKAGRYEFRRPRADEPGDVAVRFWRQLRKEGAGRYERARWTLLFLDKRFAYAPVKA